MSKTPNSPRLGQNWEVGLWENDAHLGGESPDVATKLLAESGHQGDQWNWRIWQWGGGVPCRDVTPEC